MRAASALLALVCLAASACAKVTLPTTVPVPAETLALPALDLPFAGRVVLHFPPTATRIRDPASANADPYTHSLSESRRSASARLLRYHEAFARLAEGLTSGLFRETVVPGAGGLQAILQVVRLNYEREREELHQVLSLEIRSAEGRTLFRAVTEGQAHGDPREAPEVVNVATNQALERLSENLQQRRNEIVDGIVAHRDVRRTLHALLEPARRNGRSPRPNTAEDGERFALIVGISDYPDDRWKLRHGARDAGLVFEALNDPANRLNYADDHVVLLLDQAASASAIRQALQLWLASEVDGDDTVFFYFAGHGAYGLAASGGEARDRYFLPADYRDQPGVPDETNAMNGIPMEDIRQELSRLPARNVVMVFDACHTGGGGGETRELDRFVKQGRKSVTAVLAAAGSSQRSIDGLYTPLFVHKLRGEPDRQGRPVQPLVRLGGLAQYVAREVPQLAGSHDPPRVQVPEYRVNDLSRFFQLEVADWRER